MRRTFTQLASRAFATLAHAGRQGEVVEACSEAHRVASGVIKVIFKRVEQWLLVCDVCSRDSLRTAIEANGVPIMRTNTLVFFTVTFEMLQRAGAALCSLAPRTCNRPAPHPPLGGTPYTTNAPLRMTQPVAATRCSHHPYFSASCLPSTPPAPPLSGAPAPADGPRPGQCRPAHPGSPIPAPARPHAPPFPAHHG